MSVDITGQQSAYEGAMDAVPTVVPQSVPGTTAATLCPVCGLWTRTADSLIGITEHAPYCPQFPKEAARLIRAQKRVVDAASDVLDSLDEAMAANPTICRLGAAFDALPAEALL